MINITVHMTNEHDSTYEEIKITMEEMKQYACDKAKELYPNGHWTNIQAKDTPTIVLGSIDV